MDIARLEAVIRDSLAAGPVDPDHVPAGITVVDVHMFRVGIDQARAETHRDELRQILADWPAEAWGAPMPTLAQGPSYIHAGAVVGDQRRALVLFALGHALGFWQVVTPATLGFTGSEANQLAGQGMIMINGYQD